MKPTQKAVDLRSAGAYRLDHRAATSVALVLNPEGEMLNQGEPTDLSRVLHMIAMLEGRPFTFDDGLETVITPAEGPEIRVGGPRDHLSLLNLLLELYGEGVSPWSTTWFYYDSGPYNDSVYADFFVVAGDRLVRESVHLTVYSAGGGDIAPAFSLAYDDDEWREAFLRYWYKQFYRTTRIGQLMLVRSDKPTIFFYGGEPLEMELKRTNLLLLITIVVVILAALLK